jgi:hypothetical protein
MALVPDQSPAQQLTPAAANPPLHDRIAPHRQRHLIVPHDRVPGFEAGGGKADAWNAGGGGAGGAGPGLCWGPWSGSGGITVIVVTAPSSLS